ncbi:hypothetical protein GCM10010992_20750 [Cloacibacterium rupense]|uniref:Uncharacterized protein n=1 Tax=Cloacibacterium rupense TaxID=517423 RepID=A0ABQ2NLD0_9FLAO|nr:hypothetical protein [Cloacibacterium rupense]GGP05260.1 hypothetical protein GCM10010992_20750 [Cloacibacterium rupense]
MPTLDLTNRKPLEERNKLPTPTNEGLAKLFIGVDKVVIKSDGVYETKAMSDKIVLTISQADKIEKLNDLLQIDENNTGFYCMCLGTYAIELYSNKDIKATIGFHHGVSIRYHYWDGDAELAKSDELLNFLAEQGLTKPLYERIEEKRNMEADRIAQRKWLDIAPKCFQKYWTQICSMDSSYFVPLVKDINSEIPDRQQQIITLLQTFGKTENFWTAYPIYEELPNDILKTFETEEIIKAYLNSDRNYKTRKGLGRYLCSFEFKKTRKKYLKHITTEVIDELEKCFDNIGEKRGINEIFSLRNEKNNS